MEFQLFEVQGRDTPKPTTRETSEEMLGLMVQKPFGFGLRKYRVQVSETVGFRLKGLCFQVQRVLPGKPRGDDTSFTGWRGFALRWSLR